MLKSIKLESTKYWSPLDQGRKRDEQLERTRVASQRYLSFAIVTSIAIALLIAIAVGAFDGVDVLGPAQKIGNSLNAG